MRKLLFLLTGAFFIFTLVSCGGEGGQNTESTSNTDNTELVCDEGYVKVGDQCIPDSTEDADPVLSGIENVEITIGDSFDPLEGVTASDREDGDLTSAIEVNGLVETDETGVYTLVYIVEDSAGNEDRQTITVTVVGVEGCPIHYEEVDGECVKIPAEEIVIMHGAVYEIDPFHENYSGTDQLLRQELQTEVEEQYNVEILYRNYPASAAWGPDRVTSIIQASVVGEPLSDIYWITSDWIQELVNGNALADVSQYMNTIGSNIDDAYLDIGEYQDGIYGFESYKPTMNGGLYYNADLVDSLGVDNPTDLYLSGEWNWSEFENWTTQVQTSLDGQGEEMYALGGVLSDYARYMISLNGGSLINKQTGRVGFSQAPALETYDFLTTLWDKGLFEPNGQYDSGSPLWMSGKVAMHPGDLWFLSADNRWGTIPFELGFVPYPVADDYTDEYTSPISGVSIMAIASGMSSEREELVFRVWNALQLWKTNEQTDEDFELSLLTKFDKQKYVDAYLEIYDKVHLDITNAIGISPYSENGWVSNINSAIKEGTSRTAVDTISPIYEAALEDYLD
ncbi:MAG: extracellular solute-binding protein [Candidatus Izemoplasmatales bacterium]